MKHLSKLFCALSLLCFIGLLFMAGCGGGGGGSASDRDHAPTPDRDQYSFLVEVTNL